MAEVTRASGIAVSISGPAELGREAPPQKRGARVAKRGVPGTPADGGLILDALAGQDLELVDSIPLTIPLQARPKRRGAAAPASAVALDVPLGPDEQAVILLEDEGEYRWIVDGKPLASATPKRGKSAPKRQVRFEIELIASPPPPTIAVKRGGVKRNWLVDKLVGKVTAYVFRFAIKLAGKKVVEFLERKVEQGLVAITKNDPREWTLLDDDAPLPQPLPPDRPARVLLFVHGTFSSTVGSFGALGIVPQGSEFLTRARANYDAVLGFDHTTLSVDPLANAKDILKRLRKIKWSQPPRIDMIAYSRGGLVARSLIEHLLPGSGWKATIGRVVFVGCTNGGTQLAEPDNWVRFADHYTNLALGATRVLSLVPGAQGVSTIAGGVIRGIGVLVKALASGAITDKQVPGLAAMEPDGEFVTTINQAQPGQPAPADAQYFAVMSNFEAGKALKSGGTPELPPKLLMRIADWGADELYREANDLVVHVRSMTQIDPELGDFVKGTLDYGTNGVVYHTNYFTRDTTAAKFIDWFELPGATPPKRAPKRGVSAKAESTKSAPVKRKPAPAKVAARQPAPAKKAAPAAPKRGVKAMKLKGGGGGGGGVRGGGAARASAKKAPAKKAAVKNAAAKKAPSAKAAAKKAPIKKAKKAAAARKPLSPAALRRAARPAAAPRGGRSLGTGKGGRAGVLVARPAPSATKTRLAKASPLKRRLRSAPLLPASGERASPPPAASASAGLPARSPKRSAKTVTAAKKAAAKKAARPSKKTGKTEQVECHFRAEMDSQVLVNKKVSVDVTIARQALEVTAGRVGDTAAAPVDVARKLIVQIAERRNFRVDGERRVEIDVPEPGEEANLSFDVTGLVAGEEGELWVQVRQGPVPLVTMKLKPRIVASASAEPVARLPVVAELSEFPAPEAPLDEMRIVELMVGDSVQYLYLFDLPSLKIREDFKSPPIQGRDTYITKILNRIGEVWAGTGQGQIEAFETDLKSIGAAMFTELMPREMQELLWEQHERIKSVQVFSMEPFIPWELVVLKDPKKAVFGDDSRFLGELGLVRWLYDGYPPAQLTIGAGRARTSSLPTAATWHCPMRPVKSG